jgi:hypothetical protein
LRLRRSILLLGRRSVLPRLPLRRLPILRLRRAILRLRGLPILRLRLPISRRLRGLRIGLRIRLRRRRATLAGLLRIPRIISVRGLTVVAGGLIHRKTVSWFFDTMVSNSASPKWGSATAREPDVCL